MAKKVKEITSEQYLALLELGIPAIAYSTSRNTLSSESVLINLMDMVDNPWRIDMEKDWTTAPGSFFVLHPNRLSYFTLVSQEETDAT